MFDVKKEELIVSAAYEMSEKFYAINGKRMRVLNIDKDDFMQDSVMYILKIYRNGYMHLDEDRNPRGMIFNMLRLFAYNYTSAKNKDRFRESVSLEKPTDEYGNTPLDLIKEESMMDPEQYTTVIYESKRAEKILKNIIENLDVTPFKTVTHLYVGKSGISLSEYNIGRLILKGYNVEKILKEYEVLPNKSEQDSRYVYVKRKINQVSNKLKKAFNKLNEDDKKAIEIYALKI